MANDFTIAAGSPALAYATSPLGKMLTTGYGDKSGAGIFDAAAGTVEAWVRYSGSGTQVFIGSDGGAWFGANDSGLQMGVDYKVGNWGVPSNINDGGWHHVVYQRDAATETMWMDGAQIGTRAATGGSGFVWGAGTKTMAYFGGAGFHWSGDIDEIRISKVLRYTGTTYTIPTGQMADDSNTISIYRFDNSTLNDAHGVITAPTVDILPNDAKFVYSPYNWQVGATTAQTNAQGSYIRFAISTTENFTLVFDSTVATVPRPYIKYRIDHGPWVKAALADAIPVALPGDNTWPNHVVEVLVASMHAFNERWTPPLGSTVIFKGISSNGKALYNYDRRPKNILIYGDSITEGLRNLAQVDTPEGNTANVLWSYLVGAAVNAEVGVVGFGSQSWQTAGNGGVPKFITAYSSKWSGVARDFTTVPVDVVVVNQGTNGDPVQADVVAWLTELYTKVPATTHTVLMVPFGGNGRAVLQAAAAQFNDPRVTVLDTNGWWNGTQASDGLHPSGYMSESVFVPRLAAFLSPILYATGGSSNPIGFYYRNAAGAAVPVYVAPAP